MRNCDEEESKKADADDEGQFHGPEDDQWFEEEGPRNGVVVPRYRLSIFGFLEEIFLVYEFSDFIVNGF